MRVHDPAHSRFLKLMFAATLAMCAFANAMHRSAPARADQASFELPTEWDGHPLRPLALSAVEQRFASQFPGQIARLTDGEQVLVWREVQRPTRMLHSAADCYRGLGYRIDDAKLERDSQERLWRCFVATQAGQRLRVCERRYQSQSRRTGHSGQCGFRAVQRVRPWAMMERCHATRFSGGVHRSRAARIDS